MRVILFIACLITIASCQLNAQDSILALRLRGKTTLKTIMNEVDDYYKSKGLHENKPNGEGEDNEYVKWKRWEWYMRDRLGPNGEFIDINQKMKDAYAFRDNREANNPLRNSPGNTNNLSTGSWSFVGPSSTGTLWSLIPGNGRVDRIAFHPTIATTIFVATPGGGFWKSTNGGASWLNLSNFLPTMGISGIVIDRLNPSIIYLLTGTGDDYHSGYFVYDFGYSRSSVGVLKSIDGGITWTTTGSLYTGGPYAGYKLVQDPRNTSILLAATNQGLYRTTNGGTSWTQVLSGNFTDVEFNPVSSANSNTAYVTGFGNYLYSNNEGLNWVPGTFNVAISPNGRNAIAVTANDTNKVYVLSGPVCNPNPFWGIYRSSNGGRNFTIGKRTPNILGADDAGNDCKDQSGYDLGIAASPTNANFIVMCGMTIWSSNDQGVNNLFHLTDYNGGPVSNVHPDVHGVEYNPLDGKLYACTDGGLYVSSNNGTNWSNLSNGINCTQWYHFAGFPNDPTHINGGLQDNGIRNRTFYTSAFNYVSGGDGFDCAYDPNNSSRFYSIINTNGYVFTGDGQTSINGSDFTNYFPKVGRHPTNTNRIYVGREDAIFESANEGLSFGGPSFQSGGNRRIVVCPSLTTTSYAANSSKIWKNISDGSAFSYTDLTINPGWPPGNPTITCVAVNPTNANDVIVTFGGFIDSIKVLYSYTGGALWSNESNSLPNVPVNCAVMNNDNSIYIGTDDGIYYQAANDSDWLPYYNGLPRVPVTDLALFQSQGLIYASTFGRGIWSSIIKQSCDVDLSLSGTVGGQLFTQASNSITSTQVLSGGEGTSIFNRSGNYINMLPGFEVKAGNKFKGYIGPCDLHGIPTLAPNGNPATPKGPLEFADYILPYDSAKKTNLPFGYIELKRASSTNCQVAIRAKEAGMYSLKIVNIRREILQEVYAASLIPGESTITFNHSPLATGLYYLELWYGDKLAHFQEFRTP